MKKTLTLLMALATTAGLSAQPLASSALKMQGAKTMRLNATLANGLKAAKTGESAMLKSAATGNYYVRPAGSMEYGFDTEGYGAYAGIIIFPAFSDAVFENKNTDPTSTSWTINGQDGSDYVDANGDFVFPYVYPKSMYYTPTIKKEAEEWEPVSRYGDGQYGYYFGSDSITALTPNGMHLDGCKSYYGTSGFNDKYYLFGSGNATLEAEDGSEVQYPMDGVEQHFSKPLSPLYVENVYFTTYTFNDVADPFKDASKKITLEIIGDNGETIATLKAGKDNLLQLGDPENMGSNVGVMREYSLIFQNTVKDPISGAETAQPFVINDGYTLKLTGFSQEGVELGLGGFVSAPEDVPNEAAKILLAGNDKPITYQMGLGITPTFTGLFDVANVASTLSNSQTGETYENTNVIRLSDDGQSCSIDGMSDLPAAFVYTATDWFDLQTEEEFYTVEFEKSSEDNTDWITDVLVDNSYYYQTSNGNQYATGLNYVGFKGEPVDAGKGRWAVGYVMGHGLVKSETPIIILQGTAKLSDVEIPNAIEGVQDNTVKNNADAPVYNLAGQRVTKAAKGILIQNGRKFINK